MPGGFDAWLNQAGYIGVFLATLIGNLGIPALGSAVMVLMLRFLVSPDWWLAGAVATAGETAGQFLLYCAARFGAGALLSRATQRAQASTRQRNGFERFYRRYGNAAVLICRFVPGIKSMSGFPAGLARMPIPAFLIYSTLGTSLCWLVVCWSVHKIGGRSSAFTAHARHYGPLAFVLLIVALGLFALVRKTLRRRART